MSSIKFGTDGWRAVIADEFTFANVRKVAYGIGNYVIQNEWKDKEIIVGYDTRFLSDAFAREISILLSTMGLNVVLSDSFLPSPALSYTVVDRKAICGVMVTASHNPKEYNGIKFKPSYGGSATREITDTIQNEINAASDEIERPHLAQVSIMDFKENYINRIKKMVDLDSISSFKPKMTIDPMFGATQGYLSQILDECGCNVTLIHNDINPSFDSINPEPVEENMHDLMRTVTERKCILGLASDGDGDRAGAVDEDGRFVGSQEIFPLLIEYLAHSRGERGKVVKTVSTSSLVNAVCRDLGLELIVTPVGFKYIASLMLTDNVMIGGEESGGIGFRGFIPERDGTLTNLKVVEMVSWRRKNLKELLQEIWSRYGRFYYQRVDKRITDVDKNSIIKKIETLTPTNLAGLKVINTSKLDGYKIFLEEDAWLLIRPSGTEPIVRLYSEARHEQIVEHLLNLADSMVTSAVEDLGKQLPGEVVHPDIEPIVTRPA